MNLYKNVNSGIACDFNRTFSGRWPIPYAGLAIGGSLFLYGTYFNSTIVMRGALLAIPIVIDFLRIIPDAKI